MLILDIPELANLLASYLFLLDLSICIRVSKTWNYTFVPHLWHIIPPPASIFMAQSTYESAELLRLATRSDFLAAQQQPQDSSQGINNNTACSSPSSSLLSKYGPLIRRLTLEQWQLKEQPAARYGAFFSHFHRTTTTTITATVDPTQDPTSREPTEQELLLHLLKYCPNLQSLHLDQWSGTDADLDFWRAFARDVVPSLVQFSVGFIYQCPNREKPYTGPVTVSIPPILIDKCSSKMSQLSIPYTNVFMETSLQEQERDQDVEAAAMVSISNKATEDAAEENED